MAETADLPVWMDRVSRCSTRKQVLSVLDDFRKQTWTDDECSQMGRHYIRLIYDMPDGTDSCDQAEQAAVESEGSTDDGPVWYEKM